MFLQIHISLRVLIILIIIRNNCRLNMIMILDNKPKRAMSRVRQVNPEPMKFTEVKDKRLLKATPMERKKLIFVILIHIMRMSVVLK